jgi:hypothetical protein
MSDETTVRLTYAELAAARGITLAAARRLAGRHRWPKAVGNDGLSHVTVPRSALVPDPRVIGKDDGSDDVTLDPSSIEAIADATVVALVNATADATHVVATLEGALAALQQQLAAERERADRAERALHEEMVEHRRVVEALVNQIPERRWWHWRRA